MLTNIVIGCLIFTVNSRRDGFTISPDVVMIMGKDGVIGLSTCHALSCPAPVFLKQPFARSFEDGEYF